MELNTILNKCAWADAAARLNNNFQRIRIALVTSENNVSKNKGYFSSVEELNAAHPDAVAGCQAYVGTSEPYAIYRWIIDETTGIGSWVDTGETGGSEQIQTDEFVKAEQIENPSVVVDPTAVLIQLLQGDKKLYPSTTTDAVVDATTLKSLGTLLTELQDAVNEEIKRVDSKITDLGVFTTMTDFKSKLNTTKTSGRYMGVLHLSTLKFPFVLTVSAGGSYHVHQSLFMNTTTDVLNSEDIAANTGYAGDRLFTRTVENNLAFAATEWKDDIQSLQNSLSTISTDVSGLKQSLNTANDGITANAQTIAQMATQILDLQNKTVYLTSAEYQDLVDADKLDETVEYNIYED